jgi:uncharacterized protein YebE (UPF0316 family)
MHAEKALVIAGLVLAEVGLWQWRMVISGRGGKVAAMLLGGVGAILQITAISQVVTNLDDPLSVAAYALGVSLGVLLGLVMGERLTPGTVGVTVVTTSTGLADDLWARGWPVTLQQGQGGDGPVDIVFVAVNRRQEPALRRTIRQLAPSAFWRSEEQLGTSGALRPTTTVDVPLRQPTDVTGSW